jgi:hypothetical protein
MLRWYVMPFEIVVTGHGPTRRPEFLSTIAPNAERSFVVVNDNWGVGWVDLLDAEHAAYNASAGVLFLTDDLTATLSVAQVTGVQTGLGNRNLPSSWVDTTDTWHDVIKRVIGFIMCIQCYWGVVKQQTGAGGSLNVGVPVTTPISSLSQIVQDRLDIVAQTFAGGALPAVDHVNDTVETMMMNWADALMNRPLPIGFSTALGEQIIL